MAQKTVQELLAAVIEAKSDDAAKSSAFDAASKAKDEALAAKKLATSALSTADANLMLIPAHKFYDAGNGNVASNIDGTVIIDVIHPGTDTVEVPDPPAPVVAPVVPTVPDSSGATVDPGAPVIDPAIDPATGLPVAHTA